MGLWKRTIAKGAVAVETYLARRTTTSSAAWCGRPRSAWPTSSSATSDYTEREGTPALWRAGRGLR